MFKEYYNERRVILSCAEPRLASSARSRRGTGALGMMGSLGGITVLLLVASIVSGAALVNRTRSTQPSWWPSEDALGAAHERRRRLVSEGVVSDECRLLLFDAGLSWLIRPFTCSSAMKTSYVEMVIGTGLGDTGTRSVASVVDALGVPTCHQVSETINVLKKSTVNDMSAFKASRAWFDTPVGTIWRRLAPGRDDGGSFTLSCFAIRDVPDRRVSRCHKLTRFMPRLACAFPNHKIIHTTRYPYKRDFTTNAAQYCDSTKRSIKNLVLSRCIEYGRTCPNLADGLAAFDEVAESLAVYSSPERVHVMNLSTGFRLYPLSKFLHRPPGKDTRGFPHSTEFFCHKVDAKGHSVGKPRSKSHRTKRPNSGNPQKGKKTGTKGG